MKNSHQVEFYFDCSSPWTYLAFTEILPLSQRLGIEIIWKPILVGEYLTMLIKMYMSLEVNPIH